MQSGITVQKVVLGVVGTIVVGLLVWWLHCLGVAVQEKANDVQDKINKEKAASAMMLKSATTTDTQNSSSCARWKNFGAMRTVCQMSYLS